MVKEQKGRILYLPTHLVKPSPGGRVHITPQLQELSASIRQVGMLQPLTVRKAGEYYTVVSGNRRLMAARMAGLGELPCLLTDAGVQDAALLSLTENLQREDLTYFQEAELLQKFLSHSGLTQLEAAKKLGRSQSAIANKLRLLQHSPKVRFRLQELGLSERHARELLRVYGEEARMQVLEVLAQKHMTIAQAERYIDTYNKNRHTPMDRRCRLRDTQLFLQRLDQDTAVLRNLGIAAEMDRREDEREIVLTVRIPQEM